MAGVLLFLEYTGPWVEPQHKRKGKIKNRLWCIFLSGEIDLAVGNQADGSGTGAHEGSEDVWFVGRKKNHFRRAYS